MCVKGVWQIRRKEGAEDASETRCLGDESLLRLEYAKIGDFEILRLRHHDS